MWHEAVEKVTPWWWVSDAVGGMSTEGRTDDQYGPVGEVGFLLDGARRHWQYQEDDLIDAIAGGPRPHLSYI